MSHASIPPASLLEVIMARRSNGRLLAPGPGRQQLDEVFQAALSAPDHGLLKPWRFIVVEGEQREKLGELFRLAYQTDAPGETAQHERIAAHPLRAPVIIIAVAHIYPDTSIPVEEQVLSTGAAVENMLLMLDVLEYGAIWRTGFLAGSPTLKKLLGLQPTDIIAGFIYTGTPEKWLEKHPVADVNRYVQYGLDTPADS